MSLTYLPSPMYYPGMRNCIVCKKKMLKTVGPQKYCSLKCQHSTWKKPCKQCGAVFIPSEQRVVFCTRSCGAKWKMTQPNIVSKMIASKDWEKIGREVSRSIRSNPKEMLRRKEVGKRLSKTYAGWRRYDTKMVTPAEGFLLASFPGSVHNFKVITGESAKLGNAAYYKIDLAWPDIRLAVEIDGNYHLTAIQRGKDRIRDTFLKACGWTVLRFSNNRVIRDVIQVRGSIELAISKLKDEQDEGKIRDELGG